MREKKKKTTIQKRESIVAWLFLMPSLAGIMFFILIPFGDVVRRSFYEAMSGKFVGIDNYITVFINEAFKLAAKNTGRFILICIPLLLVISLFLSILVMGQKKFGDFFKSSFLIPMAIPVASIVLLWDIFFNKNGLLNRMLSMLGGQSVDWMHTSKAFYILVFSYLWKNTGYDMVLWLAGLNGIPLALYEAAAIDGAGTWGKFRYITLPGLLPTAFTLFVLSLINSFKVFREAYLIAGSYPDNSIYMLQHLFNNWFVTMDIQKMCAAAIVVAITLLIFILIVRRFSNRGEEDSI
ncbi:MAG: sugar ABC transporter permease [Anaerocolumna aminovalerica]|jgi:multiple sugar transport system permease protein|uniref:carbohydrate ABC transporter permease n=1 Tax=Anaerocolumna aminovalerica TaxID=1527 RepID=UPI000BE307D3|nr:sugar ABC transporter permease [Anaerocolumna aminovalerica]MBU5334134.1 sugar ABC transporter permease [Anaerocolumna aminovalerica]MDU6266445.1 sugar ABC transporter permease [Anaerocolumna aminovalerica]